MSFDLDDDPLPTEPPGFRYKPKPKEEGRSLPHSLEAEEYLLSCLLMDGQDVVPRCMEMQIHPRDFYDPKHAIVYGCILHLHEAAKPIEISIVAEELKRTKQLDQVGGYAFLAQVSSRIPTTAQSSYFIDKVKEQALLREIIRSATGVVEDAYKFTGGIDQFSADAVQRIEHVATGATGALQMLAACQFDPKKPIVDGKVVLKLNGVIVCTAGNLTAVVAPSGVGKSAAIGATIAAFCVTGTDDVDTLGFEGPNYEKLPVLHFDTEQSESDFQKLIHRSMRRAEIDALPDWLKSFHLTGKSAGEARHLVEAAISHYGRKHGSLHAVIIDGWADLVVDPNDTAECFPFIARMHMLAIKYKCSIIGVVHLNPGSEAKIRGHLGSQIERKAETVLQLSMDDDLITAIWASKKRGAPLRKEDGPRFKWNDSRQMHTTMGDWREQKAKDREEKKVAREQNRPTSFREKYNRIDLLKYFPLAGEPMRPRQELIRRMNDTIKVTDRSFSRIVGEMLELGWIEKSESGYRRTLTGDDWVLRGSEPPPIDEEAFEP